MVDLIKGYIENRIQLVKLEIVSIAAKLSAWIISSIVSLLLVIGVLFMFSIALALWIGQYYNSNALGFAIVGGVFLLTFIIYITFIKKAIDTKVKNEVVKSSLKAVDDLIND